MNRRFLCSLAFSVCLFGTLRAQGDGKALVVSPLPTFGELAKAGMRFRLPDGLFSSSRPGNKYLGLTGDKVTIALKSGDLVSPFIAWDTINCSFSGDELAPPGEYYPPPLPINDQSRAASLHLSSGDEAAKTFKNAVAILQTLGIQDAKLTTWFENEIWKNSPNFQGKYAGTNGVEISLHVGVDNDQKNGRLSVNLSQSKSPKPTGTELQAIPTRQVRPIQAR